MQLIRRDCRPPGAGVRCNRGVALTEFALGLPLLLLLILFGLEVSNLIIAHLLISRVTSMTADNAGRVRDSIDESDINELMTGAELASGSLHIAQNGRVILSALQVNNAGNGQWIRWQRCYGAMPATSSYGLAGKGQNDTSLQAMGPASHQVSAASGTTVMFVEVQYQYTPLISMFGTPRTIQYTSAYNVRDRPNGDPTNAGSLPPSKTSQC